MDLGVLILTYIMLRWGLNIVVGLRRPAPAPLGYVAFYVAGADTYALLSTQHGLGFGLVPPIAGMLAASSGTSSAFLRRGCAATTSRSSPWGSARSYGS